jgi:hypothetical protein
VKVLVFARAGSPGPRHRDTFFASKAHLPSNPESAGFKKMKDLSDESLFIFSVESFEAGKQPHVFSRPSGTIEFAPIQEALRNTMALSVQCLAPGDEHQGDVGLGPIEAKSYATESYATEVFKEYTTHGR